MYECLDLPSPIEGVIHIDPPNRSLRKEDFISPQEEKGLKQVVASLEGLTEKQQSVGTKYFYRCITLRLRIISTGARFFANETCSF